MEMEVSLSIVNLAITLSGIMLCVLGSVVLIVEKHVEEATMRFFRLVLFCLASYILASMVSLLIGGRPEKRWHPIYEISVYLEFLFGYLLILLDSLYLYYQVFPKKTYVVLRRLVFLYFLFEIVTLTWSVFTGLYYTIGPDNVYRRNPDTYWISSAFTLLVLLIDIVVYYVKRRQLSQDLRIAFAFFLYMPFVGMILQLFLYELHVPITLSILCTMVMFIYVLHDQTDKSIRQAKENAEMRQSIMLSQIQPHFMFNSLGSIRELCHTDPPKAEEAVVLFSQYLRGNMDSLQSKAPIDFLDELRHTQNYVALEKLRFGDILQVVYDIRATDFRLPTLSLQPMVENAVRHGVRKNENGGTVTVRSYAEEDSRIVEVEDDGPGFDPNAPHTDGRSHVGIQNVRNRLKQMCDGELEIQSQLGKGTKVRIIIPQ